MNITKKYPKGKRVSIQKKAVILTGPSRMKNSMPGASVISRRGKMAAVYKRGMKSK